MHETKTKLKRIGLKDITCPTLASEKRGGPHLRGKQRRVIFSQRLLGRLLETGTKIDQ